MNFLKSQLRFLPGDLITYFNPKTSRHHLYDYIALCTAIYRLPPSTIGELFRVHVIWFRYASKKALKVDYYNIVLNTSNSSHERFFKLDFDAL